MDAYQFKGGKNKTRRCINFVRADHVDSVDCKTELTKDRVSGTTTDELRKSTETSTSDFIDLTRL